MSSALGPAEIRAVVQRCGALRKLMNAKGVGSDEQRELAREMACNHV